MIVNFSIIKIMDNMTRKEQAQLQEHITAIAQILYNNADPAKLETLSGIEEEIRRLTQGLVTPELAFFLSKKLQVQQQAKREN